MTKDLVRRNDGKSFYKKCENLAAILDFRYEGDIELHLFCQNQIPHAWKHINRGFICYSVMFCCSAMAFCDIWQNWPFSRHFKITSNFGPYTQELPFETGFIWKSTSELTRKTSFQVIIAKYDLLGQSDTRSFCKKCENLAAILDFRYEGDLAQSLFCLNRIARGRKHINSTLFH